MWWLFAKLATNEETQDFSLHFFKKKTPEKTQFSLSIVSLMKVIIIIKLCIIEHFWWWNPWKDNYYGSKKV